MTKVVVLTFLISLFSPLFSWSQETSIDSLEENLSTVRADTAKLNTLIQLSKLYRSSNPEKSLVYGQQAYGLASGLKDLMGMAEASYYMGTSYWIQSEYDSAMYHLQQSLDISQQICDRRGIGRSYTVMGIIARNKGNYVGALEYQQLALTNYLESGYTQGILNTYSNIGAIYYKQGNLEEALSNYLNALTVSETMPDNQNSAAIYNNIGLVYADQREDSAALYYFKRALNLQEKNDNQRVMADIYVNIAYVLEKGDSTMAFENYRKARKIYSDLNDEQGVAAVIMGMGDLYLQQNHLSNALRCYREALTRFESISYNDGVVQTLNSIASVFLKEKDARQSVYYGERSMKLAQELHAMNAMANTANTLFKAYEQTGNYQKAYENLYLYQQYRDSLEEQQNAEKIAQIKFDYELDRKEVENKSLKIQNKYQAGQVQLQKMWRNIFIVGFIMMIGLSFGFLRGRQREKKANQTLSCQNQKISALVADLKKMNNQIKEQNQDLEEQNKSKDKLFSIISHDLRSPLNSLSSLLSLLQEGDLTGEEVQHVLPDIAGQLNNSHTLLDNLLVWAKSQMEGLGPFIQQIELAPLVAETIDLLVPPAEEKQITLINQVNDAMVLADLNMIRLVLRNLISNAIKFTRAGGMVEVFSEELPDGFLQVSVKDTGVGIDQSVLKKLFKEVQQSAVGTQGEKGTGLGLLLSKDFVERNGGTIEVESEKERGSIFRFTVPLAPNTQY